VARIVDLTLPLGPHNPRVQFEPFRRIEVDGWTITKVTFDTHAGTHLDAPSHQVPNAPTLDGVDIAKCVGPAFLCDLRHVRPHEQIEPEDFAPRADRFDVVALPLRLTGRDGSPTRAVAIVRSPGESGSA